MQSSVLGDRLRRFWSWVDNLGATRPQPLGRRRRLTVECLEDRFVPAPVATTSIAPPASALIGEQATIRVTFDNTSPVATDVGYGPYVDLYLRATGRDGDDGVSFANATYLGLPVNATVLTLTAAGVAHPFARNAAGNPIIIVPPPGFRAGDQLVVFELPFGSYTPAQPPVDLNVTVNVSNLADLDAPLPVRAQGGFRFGADPLDNPTTDPTIIGPAVNGTITPQLFTLRKEYVGPENETATGPNFVRQYRVIVDIANGQTVTNLNLTDVLPGNLQFVSVDAVTGNGTGLVTAVATPSTSTPGGTLTRRLDLATGTAGNSDAVMTFSFYAPLLTAPPNSQEVLDLNTGLPTTAIDDVRASGRWDPVDPRDPVTTVTSDDTPNDHTLTLRSLATQKTAALVNDTGAPGYTPGDTVEYTLRVQVSDYFAFANVILTDLLGDGLLFDAGFTPTLVVSEHGVNTTTTFAVANFTVAPGTPADAVTFRVSDQLVDEGQDGILQGGNIPDGGTGGPPPQSAPPLFAPGTTVTVRYRAVIQDTYEQNQPSGTNTVVPGDTLSNDLTVSGEVLDFTDLSPQPGNPTPTVTDDSSAPISIVRTRASKTVYAVNGNTNIGSSIAVNAGDTVTYRVTVTLPTTSANNFRVTDFLPLPLFDANELTTLSLTTPSATPPPAGTATLGPADTFFAVYDAIAGPAQIGAVDPASNSASIDFGSFNDTLNRQTTLDVLFTVTATAAPLADQLLLTNQVLTQETDSDGNTLTNIDIIQVITAEPVLTANTIRKGVVATDNPNAVFNPAVVGPVPFSAPGTAGTRFTGTITTPELVVTPIDSNLRGVDAGDRVTFAIVVANVGTGANGAFDVRIRDTLPAGFRIPTTGAGLNLTVTDGTGAAMPFTNLGSGASAGLFGTGIELTDPGPTAVPTGALDPGRDAQGNLLNTGQNLVVITYDLEVVGTITPNTTIVNTASLFNFASVEGGPNFLTQPLTDSAQVVTATPTIAKRLIGTEIVNANNSNTQAVIGELVTYEVTVTVPEGRTLGLSVQDTLDDGLAFVRVDSVARSPGLVAGNVTRNVSNGGRSIGFTIGTVTNNNRDNSVAETITIRYTAVVLNQASNQTGTQLNNSARLTFTGGTATTASAETITVIEPTIDVQKSAVVNGAGTIGEAGRTVEYTITLQNPSNVDAFDLTFTDPLPRAANGRTLISNPVLASVVDSAGLVTAALFQIVGSEATGYTLRTRPGVTFDFPVDPGRTITLRVIGTLPIIVQPGQLITNTATVQWTSLDGNPGQRSRFNAASTERTGSGVGPNDYRDSASATIQIASALIKTLVATSSTFTQGNDVAIGEIARYRLQFQFAQGSAPDFQFVDRLPAGMQFLNDGTTTVAFVANGPGFTLDADLTGAAVTGNQNTAVTPTFVLPVGRISVAPGSGGDVTFSFGNVINNDNDNDQELVIVEFNALVLNEAANQAGRNLANDFIARDAAGQIGNPSAAVNLRVVEPNLTTDKRADPTIGDAGDRIEFVVTVTNASGATVTTAHDLRVLDVLPPEYTLDPSSVSVSPLGTFTTFVNNSAGNTIDVSAATLAPGASLVIRYAGILNSLVAPQQLIENTATTTYTSLPGPTGTAPNPTGSVTPGASGAPNGERNGSGGVNDYFSSDRAQVEVPNLAMLKVVSGSSFPETGRDQHDPAITDLAIGEIVTYIVGFGLPEVTTPAVLVDDLPIITGWLEALSSRVVSIGGNISGSLLAVGDPGVLSDRNNDGIADRVTFNFGTLTNLGDNVIDLNDLIFVEITARVLDLPQNANGTILVNTATLQFAGGQLTDTAEVEIVEPELEITKNIVSTTTINAGGVVDYEARITHTAASTMDAVNVQVTDLLSDPDLTLVPGSVVVISSATPTITPQAPDGFQVSLASIPLGEEVIIRYQATVSATANPGDVLPNTIDVAYNGTPGDPAVRPRNDEATANLVLNGASVSGFVFHEQRPGPSLPIPGTTLILVGFDIGNQPVLRTTTTDGTGAYVFANLTPGNYIIIEVQPAGFISSRQEVGSPFGTGSPAENRLTLTIPAGQTGAGTGFNFFEVQPSSLAGFVYEDVVNNGVRDPATDPGIPGVTITLTGTDWNGLAINRVVQTDAAGAYLFNNLLPGDYQINQTQPAGFLDGDETLGSLGTSISANDEFTIDDLGQALTGIDYNFGELRPSSLSGFVYLDRNNNGLKDPNEPGIAGVVVLLSGTDDRGNPVTGRATTSANGGYVFLNLRPSSPQGYTLTQIQPVRYIDGLDTAGSLGGVARNDIPDEIIEQIIVGPNQNGIDYLFGELRLRFPTKRDFLMGG
ncbi:MAG: isopeptide-forming domain-containing fimbrial protein [Planctomycetia bacterium]|nr:isopeptide-forming domain-containing fimbrial protein [Planctomycetia bacterium]